VELYDETGDPDELRNLADDPTHRATRTDLQRRLHAIIGNAAATQAR
jgi:hypothetical protein